MKKAGLLTLFFVLCSALVIPANLNNNNKAQDDLQDKIELGRQGGTTRVAGRSMLSIQSMAAAPSVDAYSSNNILQISVQNYRGPVWVEIYGRKGSKSANFEVYDMGFDVISLSDLGADEYTIRITVGSEVFTGKLYKGKNGKR